MTSKINVAVLFGGRSPEHEISVISGLEILSAIDRSRYNAIPVYVDQRGRWYTGEALLQQNFYRKVPAALEDLKEVTLLPRPGTGGLTVLSAKRGFTLFAAKEEIIPVDVYFPAFHGLVGEDGCIQGLFEVSDVPYTGCGVLASSVAMSKEICKRLVADHGVPVLPGITVTKRAAQQNLASVRASILAVEGLKNFPLFVKPVNLGSSVGVSVAKDQAGLDAGLAKVFQYDFEALVEPCISSRLEVNVSVRDTPEIQASVTETPVSSGELLSYEDKYLRGAKKTGAPSSAQGMAALVRVIDPPALEIRFKTEAISHAKTSYRVLGCSGVVRFDFMIDLKTDTLYFNELNPFPGSFAYYLWEKSNPPVLYPELIHDQIQSALIKHEQRAGLDRNFGFRALLR